MNAQPIAADSAPMEEPTPWTERGMRAVERMRDLGYTSVHSMADATEMNRQTVTKIATGDPSATRKSIQRFEAAVEQLDAEMGSDRDDLPMLAHSSSDQIEFRIGGSFGVEVIVKCAPDQLDATVAAVEALVQRMSSQA